MRSQKTLAMLARAGEHCYGGCRLGLVTSWLWRQPLQQIIAVMKETRIASAVSRKVGDLLHLRSHPGRNGIATQSRCAQAFSSRRSIHRIHSNAPKLTTGCAA